MTDNIYAISGFYPDHIPGGYIDIEKTRMLKDGLFEIFWDKVNDPEWTLVRISYTDNQVMENGLPGRRIGYRFDAGKQMKKEYVVPSPMLAPIMTANDFDTRDLIKALWRKVVRRD